MTTKTVRILMDNDTGDEAIYVDGKLTCKRDTVYAIDIVNACYSSPVVLSHHCVDFGGRSWPKKLTKELEAMCK